jgi:zinc/manganese transport system ATP-binding protein
VVAAPAITLADLTVRYRQHPALHHISTRVAQGALTAIVGPNGAGKSTLLKSIMGLLPTTPGQVTLAAPSRSPVSPGHRRIAYLPQLSELDRSFPITVQDCVLLGCWPASGAWGRVRAAQLASVQAALHTVALDGFERRTVGGLSSGQLQRVLFARLLVQDADLILLDEPFNAVDSHTAARLLALVQQWHRAGRTVLAVLHDDAQIHQHFPDTLLLARELVAHGPTAAVMTPANLHRARAMSEAWNDAAPWCQAGAAQPATRPAHRHAAA